ncbi:chemotaxis protein CheA [Simiduia litorea]|uniref:chemotaxis protein CheA n=1 Tax=Simiduia litorea TaxID=1435348 RepID=UPI0036F2E721
MGFGDDDDILQDFLVEAGEILEKLSEQLVELERQPDDKDLLNAIFRGFHTVKGGAGFLQLGAMVDCCHITENLFDILRTGKRSVTSELMDVVLQALDAVNLQFDEVQSREPLTPASAELIHQLERLVNLEDLNDAPTTEADAEPSPEPEGSETSALEVGKEGDITDSEFNDLLDAINPPEANSVDAKPESDEITDDEFEALLDQLHGQGKGPAKVATTPTTKPANSNDEKKGAASTSSATSSNEITEDEFDDLLDQLHGKGKGPSAVVKPITSPAAATGTSDLITDDEFEALLDELHGKGKGPVVAPKAEAPKSPPAASKIPPAASTPKPAASPSASAAAKPAATKAPAPTPAAPAPARDATPAPGAETTVRVDTQRLDDIMNMVGELVLVRNRLVRLGHNTNDEALTKAVSNLDVVTADLQTSVMKTRMQPIKKVFGRFPRVVRDLARTLKKDINLELQGEETDLDKNLVEALADPLVHLVRNSVDHGIELPDVRESKGKSRTGKVILAAEQEGDHILLSITDDGGGMDPEKLREKAVEKGILDEDAAQRLSDVEAFALIFAPGFSTKTEISDVSGRGVGMDVVKTKITQLNGSIEIQSKLNEGTRIIIKVPLTLAIMPTLMIMLANQTFALPLVSVNEIFHMDLTRINIVDGQECVTVREKAVPVFHLKRWLVKGGRDVKQPKAAHVVIVNVGTQRVGFVVDQLIGQEEVVIKPLGKMLQGTPGMAGATITGDGGIALILDVPSMLKRYAGQKR